MDDLYKIPQEFIDAHPLPEQYEWLEKGGDYPGIRHPHSWVAWVDDSFRPHVNGKYAQRQEVEDVSPFGTREEAFKYIYSLVMLGLLQEE